MDAQGIPARVRWLLAREGLTQGELVKSLSMDEPQFSRSLNGRRNFTSVDLAELAEHFGVTTDWLLGVQEELPSIAARADGSEAIRTAIGLAERYADARSVLSHVGYPSACPEMSRGGSSLWYEQGAHLALEALGALGDRPVHVNPHHLARTIEEVFAIDVAIADINGGCDGISWRSDRSALILISTSQNPARQRFTLAHELSHALSADDQQLHVDENIYDFARRKSPSEVRANAFAASFLMPDERLAEWAATGAIDREGFASLAMNLMVSPSALAWRLLNLKLIGQSERVEFSALSLAKCARLVDRANELEELVAKSSNPRIPLKLLQDSLEAYREEKSSLRLFARVAGRPVEVVRAAMDSIESVDEAMQEEVL